MAEHDHFYFPSDDEQELGTSPETKSSTESTSLDDHHPYIENEAETEQSTEQEISHPHFNWEETDEQETQTETVPSPEVSKETESSSEREELPAPSQEPELTPEPETTYTEDSSSEHSMPSETSQEEEEEQSPKSPTDLFTEHKHSLETTPNMPVSEEPEITVKPDSVTDLVLPVDEISTERELTPADHNSSSPETPVEDMPAPYTEYHSHETSEASLVHEMEQTEALKPEQPKQLSEFTAIEEEPQNMYSNSTENDREHETKIISGSIPVTVQTTTDNSMTSNTSTSVEPKQDTEMFNQTEHGAGSMRSLNLEHSTDYIMHTIDKESNMSDSEHYKEDLLNSSQPVLTEIQTEINAITTTVIPTTLDHKEETGEISTIETGSTDIISELENVEEHSNESSVTNSSIKKEHSYEVSSELETTTKESSSEKTLLKQMDIITESMGTTELTPPKETVNLDGFSSKMTDKPFIEETTEMHDSSNSTSTEKLLTSSISSTTEFKLEMKNTNLPDVEQVTETKLTFSNSDTISPGMLNEFEFGITHSAVPVDAENETSTNQVVRNIHYKHEVMNGSEPITVKETNFHTEQNMEISSNTESTTPLMYTGENNKEISDVTTQMSNINSDEAESLPTITTENLTTMKEKVHMMEEPKETEQLDSKTLYPENIQENPEEHSTIPVTTSEQMLETINANMTRDKQLVGVTLAETDITTIPNITDVNSEVTTVKSTTQSLDDSEISTIYMPISGSDKDLIRDEATKKVLEPTHPEIVVTTEMTKLNDSNKSEEQNAPVNFVAEDKPEMTTLPMELSNMKGANNVSNTDEMVLVPTENQELNNQSSTEQSPMPLHTANTSPQTDDMPMISVTNIPDLLGPYSVHTIINPPTSYSNEDDSNREHIEDNHHTDITADTLNSLDDDYTEDDKKKYYRPNKSKNFKNFKIQEVNIPIDSLADETTKDLQHSQHGPGDFTQIDTTTVPPSVIKDELNSNEAFTTIRPLFFATPKKISTTPSDLPQDKDEHLNGLFFSNEAETTKSPIFDNDVIRKNKTEELPEKKDQLAVDLNHLGTTIENVDKEPVMETVVPFEGTANETVPSTPQPLETITSNSSNLNTASEPPSMTVKPESDAGASMMKLQDSTSKPLNSSGLVEQLNPSTKCATG